MDPTVTENKILRVDGTVAGGPIPYWILKINFVHQVELGVCFKPNLWATRMMTMTMMHLR